MRQQALVVSASQKTGVPAGLIEAVVHQESGFRPCSVSEKGAMGLMQLMPATAEELGVADPFDPDQNVEAGAKLLKTLLNKYNGDLNRALGAYNAGTKRVEEAGGVPAIPETMKYVEKILERLAAGGTDPASSEQVVHREEDHDEEEEKTAGNDGFRQSRTVFDVHEEQDHERGFDDRDGEGDHQVE
jgi:hypothetical protein